MCDSVQHVLDQLRPGLEYNVSFVKQYIKGRGLDLGSSCCPLQHEDCVHYDISPQPLCVEQVGKEKFIQADATKVDFAFGWDFIFSSHMVEDLPSKPHIVDTLNRWAMYIKPSGHLILLLPDMEGGRYPKVEDPTGNPSHQVNVGPVFMMSILNYLP